MSDVDKADRKIMAGWSRDNTKLVRFTQGLISFR